MRVYLTIFTMFVVLMTFQAIHYLQFQEETAKFVNKGPRFTALDGQALCERIRKLEKEPQECLFVK